MMIDNPADYTLRVRFRIPAGHRIGVDAAEFVITPNSGRDLILRSGENGKSISDAEWLTMESSGWESTEAAEAAAEPLMDALRRSLVRHQLGVDLGRRDNRGGVRFTPAAVKEMQEVLGQPVQILTDVHGPMVYPTLPCPLLASGNGVGSWPPVRAERWKRTFLLSLDCSRSLSDRERTAFDLFNASRQVRESVDAQFVLLFAAFESLLEPEERPKWAVDHVDQLIALTSALAVEDDADRREKDSLLGSLRWLRNHSIRSAGRKLVRESLGGRTYQGRSAESLFSACYDLRNRLVHGAINYPTPDEVRKLVGGLDRMVGDLLARPLLDSETE